MKHLILAAFVAVSAIGLASARPEEKYTSKYNNLNLDEILHSDRLLRNYCNCLLDKGKCTPDAAELKQILPEALENGCAKCQEVQRKAAIKVIRYLIDNKRDWWNELSVKYDPENKYLKKYEEDAKKEKIDV